MLISKLLYCSSVWANTTQKNIELLETVQNFAAWIVCGMKKFDHVTPILKQLQWPPIIKQLAVRHATMVFKCLIGLAPPYLCHKFKTRLKCTTATLGMGTTYIYHSVGQHAFTFRNQKLRNSTPDEFQCITNIPYLFGYKPSKFYTNPPSIWANLKP